GLGPLARHARHVDDAPTPPRAHQRDARLREAEVPLEVDVERLVPLPDVGVEDRPEVGVRRGAVDEDVDAAEGLYGAGGEGGDGRVVAGVGGDGEGLSAGRADGGGGLVEVGLLAGGEDDAGAGGGERLGRGAPDAPAGAGDEGDLAVEAEVEGSGHGEGRRSKVEGRRSKVEGRRSKVEGRRSKVEGPIGSAGEVPLTFDF